MTTPPTIAVFDSGVGGLTVLAELRRAFPGAAFRYLGDTARVPYGTKSGAMVTRYALEAAWYLAGEGKAASSLGGDAGAETGPGSTLAGAVDALVVACNSASAVALPTLRAAHPGLPVHGVVEPGAAAAVAATHTGRVAVLATEGTVSSGAYETAIHARDAGIEVVQVACPLFVPLAEEGLTDGPVTAAAVDHYLTPLADRQVDTVVLGCTHYPLLRKAIQARLGEGVEIVDSASALVDSLRSKVPSATVFAGGGAAERGEAGKPRGSDTSATVGNMSAASGPMDRRAALPPLQLYTTDYPDRFLRIGARFLGSPVTAPQRIDLEALVAAEWERRGSDRFLYGEGA